MARVDWLAACEVAFLDRQDRLCLIGMTTHLPVPQLPVAINQLMLVAHLVEVRQVDEFSVRVDVVMPNGLFSSPNRPGCVDIEMAGHFVLVTLRGLPLSEEGIYRFELSITGQEPVGVSIPVLLVGSAQEPARVN